MSPTNQIKTELFGRIEVIGKEQSLLPFSETSIDKAIEQLENINPILQPLLPENRSSLLGDWRLIYASNGTSVTRSILGITEILGSRIEIKKIWQMLTDLNGEIAADNRALIELPILGEYQLSAEGVWRSQLDFQTAEVTFNSFSIRATKLLGQVDWSLPEIKIPLLNVLRSEATWITSYLDEDIRIGRGATGNLFLFRR